MPPPDPPFKRLTSYLLAILLTCSLVNPDCLADKGTGESAPGSLSSLPPDTVELFSPANLSQDIPVDLNLSWYPQVHTSYYHFHLTGTSGSTSLKLEGLNLKDTVYEATGLFDSTTFYWRVRAENIAGEGAWSEVWSFTTLADTSSVDTTSVDTTLGSKIWAISKADDMLTSSPNPFLEKTDFRITGALEKNSTLVIMNSSGQCIRSFEVHPNGSGHNRITWDGRDVHGNRVPEGLYISVLRNRNKVITRKIIKLK